MGQSFIGSITGQKPNLPSLQTTQSQAILGDVAQLGNLDTLTKGTDTISAEGAALPYLMNLPDYGAMLSTATGNVGQELSGNLPTDVVDTLQTDAAERGIATGAPGSPSTNADFMEALGLTSLGEEQTGQQGFGQLMSETPTGQQFSPSSMFVSPEDQQAQATAQAYLDAAPSPEMSSLIAMMQSLTSQGGGGGGGGGISSMFSQ